MYRVVTMQNLSTALEREMESFNSKIKAKEENMMLAQQSLQAELEVARDDCDDLQRQLRMAERQLARLRRPKVQNYALSCKLCPLVKTGYLCTRTAVVRALHRGIDVLHQQVSNLEKIYQDARLFTWFVNLQFAAGSRHGEKCEGNTDRLCANV